MVRAFRNFIILYTCGVGSIFRQNIRSSLECQRGYGIQYSVLRSAGARETALSKLATAFERNILHSKFHTATHITRGRGCRMSPLEGLHPKQFPGPVLSARTTILTRASVAPCSRRSTDQPKRTAGTSLDRANLIHDPQVEVEYQSSSPTAHAIIALLSPYVRCCFELVVG